MVLTDCCTDDLMIIDDDVPPQPKKTRADYQKAYYEKHKQRLTEYRTKKYVCSLCGGKYTKTHAQCHFLTEKHTKAVALQAKLTQLPTDLVFGLAARLLGQSESGLKDLIQTIYKDAKQKEGPSVQSETIPTQEKS